MFSTLSKTLKALTLSLLAVASFASAQYDESIAQLMTSADQYMYYNAQQMANNDALLRERISQYMQDPQIQAAYNQCLQTSGMCGTLEWYAYNYMATNGFTDGGAWMRQTQRMDANLQNGWQDYQNAQRGSADVMQGWRDSNYRNQEEFGNILGGNSTWIDPTTGTNYTLPYGLESGQTWYDAGTGQYYSYNPYNWDQGAYFVSQDGQYWQQLNQWQPGQ